VTAPVLPLLRPSGWYPSHDTGPVPGAPARLSLAPEILVRDDARRLRARLPDLAPLPRAERLRLLSAAVDAFRGATVPVEGLGPQSPEAFAAALDAGSGLPGALVRRWSGTLRATADRLAAGPPGPAAAPGADAGLTLVSLPANTFTCLEAVLEAVLDSGAVWIRPSRREPLSSARLVAALLAVGWPAERLGYYPTEPRVLPALVRAADRRIVYGGPGLAVDLADGPRVDLRGPGRACAVVDAGALADPEGTAARLVPLIAADGGRFCTNVRTIACLGDPGPLASALGALLDRIPLDPPDPHWPLARCTAEEERRAALALDSGLAAGGRVVTRRRPVGGGGAPALPPTLVRVEGARHPLIGHEPLFPFAVITAADPAGARAITGGARYVYTAPFAAGVEEGGPH
jgi:hypothetical protein